VLIWLPGIIACFNFFRFAFWDVWHEKLLIFYRRTIKIYSRPCHFQFHSERSTNNCSLHFCWAMKGSYLTILRIFLNYFFRLVSTFTFLLLSTARLFLMRWVYWPLLIILHARNWPDIPHFFFLHLNHKIASSLSTRKSSYRRADKHGNEFERVQALLDKQVNMRNLENVTWRKTRKGYSGSVDNLLGASFFKDNTSWTVLLVTCKYR